MDIRYPTSRYMVSLLRSGSTYCYVQGDRLAYAGRGTVRSYALRVIGTQILELSILRIEPLRTQR
jgi:hypothetical protein